MTCKNSTVKDKFQIVAAGSYAVSIAQPDLTPVPKADSRPADFSPGKSMESCVVQLRALNLR